MLLYHPMKDLAIEIHSSASIITNLLVKDRKKSEDLNRQQKKRNKNTINQFPHASLSSQEEVFFHQNSHISFSPYFKPKKIKEIKALYTWGGLKRLVSGVQMKQIHISKEIPACIRYFTRPRTQVIQIPTKHIMSETPYEVTKMSQKRLQELSFSHG